MSVDLDQLLRDGGEPASPTDADEIWRQGRQRRRRRVVGTSVSGVAVVALLAVLPFTNSSDLRPVIDPMAQEGPATESPDDDSAVETADAVEAPDDGAQDSDGPALSSEQQAELEDLARLEAERIRQAVDEARQRMEDELDAAEAAKAEEDEEADEAEAEASQEEESEGATSPTPNQARMADPCAAHEGGEMRAFIDVVAPVDGQQVGGEIELIGCASVYEGTLQYRVLNAAGDVLLADFTTATAGGPEIGEFRETISLPAQARYLEVYWDDVASGSEQHPDGPERDLVRVKLG